MFKISKIQFFLFFSTLILLFTHCKKDVEENPVDPTYVNFTLYLNDPEFQDLKIVGNYMFVRQGGADVVIYRATLDDFYVYDRLCTYEASQTCLVQKDSNSVMVICECCNSKYILTDGSVFQSPASYPLRAYNATYDGGDYVHVTN
jgi:nitrite reductase/ring-hydroxylating ferredoxin subunit